MSPGYIATYQQAQHRIRMWKVWEEQRDDINISKQKEDIPFGI
jgi:hypothetical protein